MATQHRGALPDSPGEPLQGRDSQPSQGRDSQPPNSSNKAPPDGEGEISSAFERTVSEGLRRMSRTWPGLLATGAVGGIDVSAGILGLLVVERATGNTLLAALAFSIGFISLTLAGSELFTENFLVPIATVAARQAPLRSLARLWLGTMVTNLLGGWVMTWIIMTALPSLKPTAIRIASAYPRLGFGKQSFSLALLGGVIITLMTWMERSTTSVPGKLAAAVAAAFLLASASLNHAIVVSLEMFAALHAGAPFGYWEWLRVLGWAALGNMLGGVGLVTMLRLVQVGRKKLQEEEDKVPAPTTP